MFAYFVSVGALLPALPRYVQGPLGGGSVSVGLAVGSFSIATTLLRPLAGLIGDRRGRRLIVVAGAAVAGLSIFGYGLSESFTLLIAMRLLNGVGEALFFTGAASIVTDLAPEERQAEALSLASTAVYTGLVVGPFLGESVLGDGRFSSVWILAGVCAVVAALLGAGLPETRPPKSDTPGRTRFFHPAALLPGVIIAASVWGFAAFSTFVPLYALELGLNGSRYVFALFSVVVISIRTFGAKLPDALGVRRAASASLLTSIAGLVVMGLWGTVAGLLIGTVIAAVGQALAFPALMSMAIRRAPASERASVVGTFTSFFDLGFGLGPLAMGLVAAAFDYRAVFLASAGVAAGGRWLLLGLRVGAVERPAPAPRPRSVRERGEP
jgi:MFS family permease